MHVSALERTGVSELLDAAAARALRHPPLSA